MRDPNRPRLAHYAYGRSNPRRVHVVRMSASGAVTGPAWFVYRGTSLVSYHPTHAAAMEAAYRVATAERWGA